MKLNNEKAKELKEDFPLLKNSFIYLDNAATTQKPKQVIYSINDYYTRINSNIHRGIYDISIEATERYEKAHILVAKFLNALQEEIIFTKGTTEAMNLLAYTVDSIMDKKRKNIVLTEMEHHSNLVPWQQLAKKNNFKIKFIQMKDDFTLDIDDASEKINDETAILSINHASNALGTINDIKTLVNLGKDKGALTIVDAAQSAGNMPIDVKSINCDFLACSSHKMLGPTGMGALYGKKELLLKLRPFHFGGDMIKDVTYEDAVWNELPMKFEAGTQNISGAIGFGEAIDYLGNIGMDNIKTWEKELLKYALDSINKLNNITVYNPGFEKSIGILSFNCDGIHPHDMGSLLNDEKICIRAGHHCTMPLMKKLRIHGTTRASFHLYNTFEDVDSLINGIRKTQKLFIAQNGIS